jgi:DNA (cytosine-5)-methyltransferase 1
MRFGSVCSGIEAASVAWNPLGWEAAWLSEIEPFPCAVLKHHYPDVPNLGDMTTLPDRILSGEVEAPDLFCGGTPCQAFSVAGLRNSLDDARGNLSLTFVGIANAIDHVRSVRSDAPGIIFWENVPGVLSTKDNAFGCFLGALAGEDDPIIPSGEKWTNAGCVYGPQRTVAWRVLDAQYFGVAQRRRRVFVVASARADFDPVSVLFEFDGVRRDIAPSREAGKDVAATIAARFGISRNNHEECVSTYSTPAIGNIVTDDVSSCIARNTGSGGETQNPAFVVQKKQWSADVSPCVTNGPPFSRTGNERVEAEAMVVAARMVAFGEYSVDGTASAMKARDYKDATDLVAQPISFGIPGNWIGRKPENGGNAIEPMHNVAPCQTKTDVHGVMTPSMAVRRLTPVECERLQGFSDGYTNIPWRKKLEAPDGPRYKALGNSWAVPVVRWIGARIQERINAS